MEIYLKNDTILIIKVSRTDKVFYGICGGILDLLIEGTEEKKIYFGIVLLCNNQEGWFYPEGVVINKVQRNIWRKASDKNYRINPPLEDAFSFSSYEKFEEIFKLYSNN